MSSARSRDTFLAGYKKKSDFLLQCFLPSFFTFHVYALTILGVTAKTNCCSLCFSSCGHTTRATCDSTDEDLLACVCTVICQSEDLSSHSEIRVSQSLLHTTPHHRAPFCFLVCTDAVCPHSLRTDAHTECRQGRRHSVSKCRHYLHFLHLHTTHEAAWAVASAKGGLSEAGPLLSVVVVFP